MNAQLTTFTSLEHYEAELAGSITPMIADKFEALDETSADLLQVERNSSALDTALVEHGFICMRELEDDHSNPPGGSPSALLPPNSVLCLFARPGHRCSLLHLLPSCRLVPSGILREVREDGAV